MKLWLTKNKYWVLVLGVFIAHLAISYWGVIRYHYPVPPGDDTLAHLGIIDSLLKHPILWPTGQYPPGFHYLIIGLAKLTGATPIAVMTLAWPALVVAGGLGIFFLARRFFGNTVGLLAYVLFALICPQPLQTAYDGGFPNILATGVFLTLNIVCWIELWQRFRLRWLIGFLLTAGLIVFTHHLTTIIWLVLTVSSGVVLALVKAFTVPPKQKPLVLIGLIAVLVMLYLVYADTAVFSSAKVLADFSVKGAESPVWSISSYSSALTGLIFQFSFVGAGLAVWEVFKNKFGGRSTVWIVLLAWFGLYFIGSRLAFVVEPGRLARDLSLPATIFAAYAIFRLYDWLKSNRVLSAVFLICIALLMVGGFITKTKSQLKYSGMIRYSTADVQALQYIDSHPSYPYLVWVQNGFWQYKASGELADHKVVLVSKSGLNAVYKGRSCILAGYYQPGIWQDFLQDQTVTNKYLSDSRLSSQLLSEDQNKVWYLFCLKP